MFVSFFLVLVVSVLVLSLIDRLAVVCFVFVSFFSLVLVLSAFFLVS